MILRAMGLMLVLAAALSAAPCVGGEDLNSQEKALDAIAKFAAQICNDIPIRGEANSTDVKGDVNAKLSGLASKLAELGISGAGSIKSEQYQGVLRSDLAAALKSNSDCKLAIFNSLQAKLLSSGPAPSEDGGRQANISGVWRDVDNSNNVTQIAQQGGAFQFTRVGTLPNGLRYKSTGSGQLIGGAYSSQYIAEYQNGATSTGRCSGTLRAEGVLVSNCTDTILHEFSASAVRQ